MRSAMSMLELVVAIVVMGIVVMSLPLILTQVQNNNAFAMQQEAILAAKAKIGDILTYEWDANSYSAADQRAYVLDTSSDSELSRVVGTSRRIGHVNVDNRRKLFDTVVTPTSVANLGNDGTLNDIDDFSGLPAVALTVTAGEDAQNLDYIFDLNLTTTVTYAADAANYTSSTIGTFVLNPDNNATITNIKTISVQVAGAQNPITLRAFSCNIGESSLLPSRPYQ